jgi:hypothetical protein
MRKPYWISWYGGGSFEYTGPWWCTGDAGGFAGSPYVPIFCAAVMAESEEQALAIITECHDKPSALDVRFNEPREDSWEPFCERFPRVSWVKWPYPVEEQERTE